MEHDKFNGKKGLCIAGFVLSIIGFFISQAICGILALVFSQVAISGGCTAKIAKAGRVLGIIDIVLGIAIIVGILLMPEQIFEQFINSKVFIH